MKKRITASLGFRSVKGACRTIEGYEAMHAIRKGQVRWVPKGDPVGQLQFIHTVSASLRNSLLGLHGRDSALPLSQYFQQNPQQSRKKTNVVVF